MRLCVRLLVVWVAVLLASCGGEDGDQAHLVRYERLVSFGDSLSDVGTHNVGSIAHLSANTGGGGRWTTNGPSGGEIWTERLAMQLGMDKPCAAQTGLQPNIPDLVGAAITAVPGCYNYAQGGARVTNPLGPNSIELQGLGQSTLGLIAKPVAQQIAAHLGAVGGRYSGQELVTVMAGVNDVFMELSFLGTPLGARDAAGAVANVAQAGVALGQLVKTQIVAKGAKRVLVLNMPDVAGTPFAIRLGTSTVQLMGSMVNAFNTQLAAQLQGVPEVRLVDTYRMSQDQALNPAQYGLTNVVDVACGPNSLSSPPTANGTSLVCNASNSLAAVDVSRYQFADDVHPTAYGHLLLTQLIIKELLRAGWM